MSTVARSVFIFVSLAAAALLSMAAATGCSSHSGLSSLGIDQELRRNLFETPTTFTMAHADEATAWERAFLFFEQYTSGMQHQIQSAQSVTHRLSTKEGGDDLYLCEVLRREIAFGFGYSVSCRAANSSGSAATAELNAHNLARFIREGMLEVSLLHAQ